MSLTSSARGRNYGWPIVSNGINYNGVPIPKHATRPEFEKPALSWTPVISPGGLSFYQGDLFPAWRGSAFVAGLSSKALIRLRFDGKGGAAKAERWDMGHRIRDVAVARMVRYGLSRMKKTVACSGSRPDRNWLAQTGLIFCARAMQ